MIESNVNFSKSNLEDQVSLLGIIKLSVYLIHMNVDLPTPPKHIWHVFNEDHRLSIVTAILS